MTFSSLEMLVKKASELEMSRDLQWDTTESAFAYMWNQQTETH